MIDTLLQDRYRLESEIGRGGMGTVYRAMDTLLERPVAVKFVSEAALGTEGRARLLSEARAAARLNHPNIVAVYDVGQVKLPDKEEFISFIVMELVEGQTLRSFESQDLQRIVDITTDICLALSVAHEQAIIHRDLKPENVAVTLNGTVKLMDFGLARISGKSRLTQEGALVGTLSYLAPEIILGQEATAQSDLYALGVMLYEMSAGRPPFEGDDLTAVISQHLHAPVVPPSVYNEAIPPDLDELITGLLKKRPEERPRSASILRRALQSLTLTAPVSHPAAPVTQLNRLVRGRMIGRDAEFAEAVALWERASAGNGQLLLISGEPGIGKSRLSRELVAQVEISGGMALVGACYAEGGAPYSAFSQMVRRGLRKSSADELGLPDGVLAELLKLAPDLRLLYSEVKVTEALDPQAERQRLFDSLVIFFAAASQQSPLLLVIEDAHWADSGTLDLLRYLARNTGEQSLMMAVTYREMELNEARPFNEALLDLNRERLASRLKLSHLDRQGTHDMLAALFAEEITPEFLDGIYGETEGNPFFIEEVCKALVESGKLYFENGRWHRPDIDELGIPQSVRVAIQARIKKLEPETQEILAQAAILGREFSLDVLSRASQHDDDILLEALEDAQQAQLIEAIGGQNRTDYAFAHALIPATLVDGIRLIRRRRLHRQAGEAVEATRPDDFESLAYHFSRAALDEKALVYFDKSGDRARGLYAHQEAIDSYQQALEIQKENGDLDGAARTLMKLGLTHHNAFEFAQARQAYQEGFSLWQQYNRQQPGEQLRPAPRPLRLARFDPPMLDPGRANQVDASAVIEQLFSGLLELTPELNVVPDIAVRWEVLDEGRRYIFHLGEDARWSDGSQVTAQDFVFAWRRVLDPANDDSLAAMLYDVKGAREYHEGTDGNPDQLGVKAQDPATLLVELESPSGYFLQLMAHTVAFPVPREVVRTHEEQWTDVDKIVTNGPYLLRTYRPGELIVLERNSAYHRRFSGNVDEVELWLVDADRDAILPAYDADKIDNFYLGYIPIYEQERALFKHAGDSVSGPGGGPTFLGFAANRQPFDDRRVRRALAMVTNREDLVDRFHRHYMDPADGGLVPPSMPGHSAGVGLPYDPEEARRLLAEAGYPSGKGFPVVDAFYAARVEMLDHLSTQWADELGITTRLTGLSFLETQVALSEGRGHLFIGGWVADYPDPDSFLRAASWRQMTGWRNQEYDQLVERAGRITDQTERMRLYRQADKMLVEEAIVIPIGYARFHMLLKPWVKRFPTAPIRGTFWKDVILDPDETPP